MRHIVTRMLFASASVSIHASVKDATIGANKRQKRAIVSIHASVKDATLLKKRRTVLPGFNPRICKRCDQGVAPLVGLTTYVSIHASVKDATYGNTGRTTAYLVSIHASVKDATSQKAPYFPFVSFNPRICKRCDKAYLLGFPVKKFQSTHL